MESDVKKDIFKRLAQAAIKTGVEMSPHIIVEVLYNKIFDHKIISDPIKRFEYDDFPLLIREKAKFKSGNNLLTGYFYNYKKYRTDKIVIFAHGYGNGHHRYLEIIDYLAKNGFYVFSYDCTSFDESEGDGIKGFPQGVIDLDNAITYVKRTKKYKDKDIILVGHSWGAYCVSAIINKYPHISKVVAMAGFNYAIDLVAEHGVQWAGKLIEDQIPFMKEYEKRHFGEYADYTVLKAIKKSTTKFFFIHSEDDETVPIQIGLKKYKKEFKKDPRIKYKVFKDRTHICYNTVEGNKYFTTLKAEYEKHLKPLEDKILSFDEKLHLLNLIVDKKKYLHMLNIPLMKEIVEFIEA